MNRGAGRDKIRRARYFMYESRNKEVEDEADLNNKVAKLEI